MYYTILQVLYCILTHRIKAHYLTKPQNMNGKSYQQPNYTSKRQFKLCLRHGKVLKLLKIIRLETVTFAIECSNLQRDEHTFPAQKNSSKNRR